MKISVAMCTYNGEKYIKEQLNSIIQQSRMVDEIVISDDGSKDNTLEICENILKNSGIDYKIVKNPTALRVMKNFQQCFSLCSGDIIFSCDQDDIWEYHKVENIVAYFENHPHIKMIATDASQINAEGELMNLSLREGLGFTMNTQKEVLPSLLRTFCITGATMAFQKDFENMYFYLSQYWLHDGWLALQAAMNNAFYYMNDKLTRYRLHGNNVCGVGDVDILKNGTIEQLVSVRKKKTLKTALRYPFYMEDYAKERMEMYKEVLDQIVINNWPCIDENKGMLEECIYFWEKRANLRYLSFFEMLKMTKKFTGNNSYKRFSESEMFSKIDIYLWFVYKIIPRKKVKLR